MRFAILHHTGSALHPDHYDLLIQTAEGADDDDCVLEAFATVRDEFPEPAAGAPVSLKRLALHRRVYLDYEGALSRERGQVARADGGVCILRERTAAAAVYELQGARLAGKFRLRSQGGGVAWEKFE